MAAHPSPKETRASPNAVKAGARKPLLSDARIVAVLFAAALILGTAYAVPWGGAPRGIGKFAYWWFGPSVMIASGNGFVHTDIPKIPHLREFLRREIDTYPRDEAPRNPPARPLGNWHETHRYLVLTVGLYWRVFGISWTALGPLYGAFLALSVVLAYGLFRLGANRLVATALALSYMVWPSTLEILPNIRDFFKVPWILAAIFIMVLLCKEPRSKRALLGWSAALGAVIGIGLGFRLDLLIYLYAAIIVLAVFLPGNPLRDIGLRVAAIAVLLLCFYTTARPVLQSLHADESTAPHNILGGLGRGYDLELGVGGTPYSWFQRGKDALIHSAVASHAHRARGETERVADHTSAYGRAAKRYLRDIVVTFPADFIIRAYAALLRTLEGAEFSPNPGSSRGDEFVARMVDGTHPLLCHVWKYGKYYTAAGLLLLSLDSLRLALAGLFFVLYLGGHGCLQFQLRHYSHLSIIPLWFMGFVIYHISTSVLQLRDSRARRAAKEIVLSPRAWWTPPLKRALLLTAGALTLLAVPLWAARAYQDRVVGSLLERYANVEREKLDLGTLEADTPEPGWTLFKPAPLFDASQYSPEQKTWHVQTEFLVIETRGDEPLPVYVKYAAHPPNFDLSHVRQPQLRPADGGETTESFIPLYESSPDMGNRKFMGVAFPSDKLSRVLGAYRLTDLGDLPVLLECALPRDGGQLQRHQTLQPLPLPLQLRARLSARHNILDNGSFERWLAPGDRLEGFEAPTRCSTVEQEAARVADGSFAIRQTWNRSDSVISPTRRFHVSVPHLGGNATYTFIAKARMLSAGNCRISAWAHRDAPNAVRPQSLGPPLFALTPGLGFKEYAGTFKTGAGEDLTVLLITSYSGNTHPATVIWDDWRLLRED